MTTFGELIDQIHSALHSYTGVREQSTWLAAALDDTATTITVQHPQRTFRGVLEVENELIAVDGVLGSNVTALPQGRGHRGTGAVAHDSGTTVVFDPAFPRKDIATALNQKILGLWPQLFQVKTTTLTDTSPVTVGYALPSDVEGVFGVDGITVGSENYRHPLSEWEFDRQSRHLHLFQWMHTPDSELRVTYQARPGTFEFPADLDTEISDMGIEESWTDLLMYGVSAQLVRFLDVGRLQPQSSENLGRASVVNPGDAGRLANQLFAMYQTRLAEERRALLALHQPRMNFNGR